LAACFCSQLCFANFIKLVCLNQAHIFSGFGFGSMLNFLYHQFINAQNKLERLSITGLFSQVNIFSLQNKLP